LFSAAFWLILTHRSHLRDSWPRLEKWPLWTYNRLCNIILNMYCKYSVFWRHFCAAYNWVDFQTNKFQWFMDLCARSVLWSDIIYCFTSIPVLTRCCAKFKVSSACDVTRNPRVLRSSLRLHQCLLTASTTRSLGVSFKAQVLLPVQYS
jgi:hypothetical protein